MPKFLVCVFLLLISISAHAQAPTLTGRWKLKLNLDSQPGTLLLAFSESSGKWVGDFIGAIPQLTQEPKFSEMQVDGNRVRFRLTFSGRDFVNFDGVLSADGKKISGSIVPLGASLQVTELLRSDLKKLDDPVELARETVNQVEVGQALFDAGMVVLEKAATKKLSPEEVRSLVEKIVKAASTYGQRWERTMILRVASTLADQQGYADIAITQARRAERMLADDDSIAMQWEVMSVLNRAFLKAGKVEEAKKYAQLATQLESKDFQDYLKKGLAFVPAEAKPRTGAVNRAVLVELFTGAEAAPTAAVDLASAGLARSYPATQLITLSYHLHAGNPDPLASPSSIERLQYYSAALNLQPTVPMILINGKLGPRGGGPAELAKAKFTEYRALIDKEPTAETAKLTLALSKTDKGYSAKATVTDLTTPGEKVSLRFALAEDRVRFTGGNGVTFHNMVVRAFPGGAKGFALPKKTHEQTVTFDLAAIRDELAKHLEEVAKSEGEFPRGSQLFALQNLKLVGWIQNDATAEVLQATMIDVK